MSIIASLRQLLHPKEFRIAAPKWPDLSKSLEDIANLLESPQYEIETSSKEGEESLNLLVEMGTVVWRLRQRLTVEGEVPEEIGRISRDLESMWDALKQGGIEIKDHTGETYDGGMALHVIAFQPMTEISKEEVIQTIRPTIYHNNKIIQKAEVIVGVPGKGEATKTGSGQS